MAQTRTHIRRVLAAATGALVTPVSIANGGTGSTTAADAAEALGVGITDSPQFTGIELGHATDTTLTRPSAGDVNVEGNRLYRAGGTDVALADGGTGASLADPNADRIQFWDDSAGAVDWLTAGSGLTITGTTITASGGPSQATQAALEAETVETTYASPDRVKFSPGVAKAYCRIDGVGALVAGSYNVSSVTDTGTGDRTIVWNTDFANANYALASTLTDTPANATIIYHNTGAIAVGSARLVVVNEVEVLADVGTATTAFGDQ